MRKAVTADEMRDLETALGESGIGPDTLIGMAAHSIESAVRDRAPTGRVLVLAGPGNNGRDGLLAARLLQAIGRDVIVFGYRVRDRMGFNGHFIDCEEDEDNRKLREAVPTGGVLIDALLGTGRSRQLDAVLATIVRTCNDHRARDSFALAVDLPTGVDCNTGDVDGDAFQADTTVCMGCVKRGTVLFPGAGFNGSRVVANLCVDATMTDHLEVDLPTPIDIAAMLPVRTTNSNKGSFGRLLFIGGSRDFLGAPVLSATAAYRIGAGLVEVAIPESAHSSVGSGIVEAIFNILSEEDGKIGRSSIEAIELSMSRATAMVVGPGMGFSDATTGVVRKILDLVDSTQVSKVVVDADGLNSLAQITDWWHCPAQLILTPHPGEMSRLTGLSVQDIQSNRLEIARKFARDRNKIVVLKGAGTVVASPWGAASINTTGGPNLATAGTGDVLSGTIGGLLAQGCPPWTAAVAGVYIHGLAGDLARERTGDSGTLSSDLLDLLPVARRSILDYAEVT
ncbi:MAG: bifunctional ADP-dependent NAD(P)H-hydrate dehydratase/NAD(P)H-hydrate epimerase [Chloroflexota bacterium]